MGYDLVSEIKNLKQKHDFAILAHYYEDGEIQDLADFVGDSYQLAIQATMLNQKNILMAGVVFMAESVKLLSPQKNVYVPDLNAGCSLVNDSPYEKYLAWRKLYPDGIAVTYVNSSVAVKSISDVIVTSSNAEKIIRSLPVDRPILFGPDKNLGKFLQKITGRKMEIWQGACQVHVLFSAKRLHQLISENPDAVVIAHPECDEPVLAYATVIGWSHPHHYLIYHSSTASAPSLVGCCFGLLRLVGWLVVCLVAVDQCTNGVVVLVLRLA
jgi:quinolinate synthase